MPKLPTTVDPQAIQAALADDPVAATVFFIAALGERHGWERVTFTTVNGESRTVGVPKLPIAEVIAVGESYALAGEGGEVMPIVNTLRKVMGGEGKHAVRNIETAVARLRSVLGSGSNPNPAALWDGCVRVAIALNGAHGAGTAGALIWESLKSAVPQAPGVFLGWIGDGAEAILRRAAKMIGHTARDFGASLGGGLMTLAIIAGAVYYFSQHRS